MEKLGALAALGAAAMWTVNSVVMERRGAGLDGGALNLGRIILGLLLIILVSGAAGLGYLPTGAGPSAWGWLLLSGLIGFALGDTMLMKAFLLIGARLTLLVFAFEPVITAALSYLIFGETLSMEGLLGMALVLGGIVVVIGGKKGGVAIPIRPLGLVFALVAAVGQSGGTIASKFGLAQIPALHATQIRLIGGLIGMLALFTFRRGWPNLGHVLHSPGGRTIILSGAVLGTLFGVVLMMYALANTRAAIASSLAATMPVLILPISRYYLKEKLRPKDLAGAVMTAAGSAILFL